MVERLREHYEKIEEWLKSSTLVYTNHSVTEENPLHCGNKYSLKRDLAKQVEASNIVIILAGMYADHSEWIQYEAEQAEINDKYIIVVEPWGQERVPVFLQECADIVVGWNASSIINAIKDSFWL